MVWKVSNTYVQQVEKKWFVKGRDPGEGRKGEESGAAFNLSVLSRHPLPWASHPRVPPWETCHATVLPSGLATVSHKGLKDCKNETSFAFVVLDDSL